MASKRRNSAKALGKDRTPRSFGHRLDRRSKTYKGDWEKRLKRYGELDRSYGRVMRLGGFAVAGATPRIRDVEVVVMFADLRGFTRYVSTLQSANLDNRAQNFLRDYYRLYPKALLHIIDDVDSCTDHGDPFHDDLANALVPTTYKNLGDGLMIVWELSDEFEAGVPFAASEEIIRFARELFRGFAHIVEHMEDRSVDMYTREARSLKLGFGICRGRAWRLDFDRGTPPDYAGSVINVAARLQDRARPSGIVVDLSVGESSLRARAKEKDGRVLEGIVVDGMGERRFNLWISKSVDARGFSKAASDRKPRTKNRRK